MHQMKDAVAWFDIVLTFLSSHADATERHNESVRDGHRSLGRVVARLQRPFFQPFDSGVATDIAFAPLRSFPVHSKRDGMRTDASCVRSENSLRSPAPPSSLLLEFASGSGRRRVELLERDQLLSFLRLLHAYSRRFPLP